ncbi:MAG: alpha-amylase [Candidatus Hydrogenedentes bacterium]|nr:alpha-amylase [Candidatus Hydrogenedentota bacterium]
MAMGLITSVLRFIVYRYAAATNPKVLADAQDWARNEHGLDVSERPFASFLALYPADPISAQSMDIPAFLEGYNSLWSNRDSARCELLLLHVSLANPAMAPYGMLFDEPRLRTETPYNTLMTALQVFLRAQPPFPETMQDLITMLYAPQLAAPDSLEGQLRFIRSHWAAFLPEVLRKQLLLAAGVLAEEIQFRGHGPGSAQVMQFGPGRGGATAYGEEEPEAFSMDKEWMPNVVLLAKTVYVWLDQLSRAYGRSIRTLDQIPDDELDRLASWGFTGLWLIGIWERSEASRTIKRKMGNPEAAASAYSLFDYEIAGELGGTPAYENLAGRAWSRGIRLASDMVPNHVGIYSKWVTEHPDWFVQARQSPFPGYTFNSESLSPDPRIGIYIEDGYWNHRDAAVVFKRVDLWTGDTRYIYHGNDGTSMPWNDTAQLNYLIPDVREAVIQTILHVARHFPIIRFDAAMTLAKKHYQRLWFPLPEEAGAIPSRAGYSMSRPAFDEAFPVEFWREVVDRVAVEVPDTLLLAEAFWLMEGYFVRTLGMHRVYNSAFMNMLKMEENQKYRQTVKNVLEFSPEILQRFVNFMNNPDEDTAEAQFGRGDKYFGVATLLVTMPGLPMVGHGQVEGYTEKYGMEYRRAYYDEVPDNNLVQRHEREIFPLMRRRNLFSGSADFAFYDFVTPDGWVDENVYAYSNRNGYDQALVVYHNAFRETQGRVHTSVPRNEGTVDNVRLRQQNIAAALGLHTDDNCYYIYRDSRTGLEYLEHAQRIRDEGIFVALGAYHYVVLMDWRAVYDMDLTWAWLHANLGGQGVPSIDEAYQELHLAPLLGPFSEFLTAALLRGIHEHKGDLKKVSDFLPTLTKFLHALGTRVGVPVNPATLVPSIQADLNAIYGLPETLRAANMIESVREAVLAALPEAPGKTLRVYRVLIVWALLRHLGGVLNDRSDHPPLSETEIAVTSGAWIREWFLRKHIAQAFLGLGEDGYEAALDASLARIGITHTHHLDDLQTEIWGPVLDTIFRDTDVLFYLGVNTWQGTRWLNRERMLSMTAALQLFIAAAESKQATPNWDRLAGAVENTGVLVEAAEGTRFDFDWMLSSVK